MPSTLIQNEGYVRLHENDRATESTKEGESCAKTVIPTAQQFECTLLFLVISQKEGNSDENVFES